MRTRCLALIASLLLAGCAAILMTDEDVARTTGRYDKLISSFEARTPSLDALNDGELTDYCHAVYGAKYYDKVQHCIDELARRVQDTRLNLPTHVYRRYQQLEVYYRAKYALDLADYNQAIEHAQRSLALITAERKKPVGYRIVSDEESLGILALANAHLGNASAARQHINDLNALSASLLYGRSETNKQMWLARGYMALGDFQNAYKAMQVDPHSFARAYGVAIWTLMGAGTKMDPSSMHDFEMLPYYFLKHKSEFETGRIAEAKVGFDKLLSSRAARANGDIHWLLLYDRGRIAEREGQLGEAARLYAEAVEVIEAQRSTLNSETSKIGFVGSKQNVYRDLIRILMIQGQIGPAFDYVERSKARALVDMLASKKDFGDASGNAERVRELLARADSAEMSARALDSSDAAVNKRTLVTQARKELATQAPELSSLVSVSTMSASAVQRALAADETLLEYFYSGDDLYAFVVTRDAISGFRLSAAGLDSDVQAFRQTVQEPASGRWKALSARLYGRLVSPVKQNLRSANVTIVPHGALHYLPFNSLHDGSQFLLENHSIRMLPAATVLKFLKPAATDKPGTLLAFGNPDLRDRRYDLAFAESETQNIVRMLPKSRALLRAAASKIAFRKYASDFRMLHVASHGEFDAAKPLASSLLLAPEAGDNGRLTVSDIYSMRVDADLVTLSACETGLGKVANGDDVVGLTRGFLYAGASTIVASLWQVDDRATGELMTSFYQALARGSGKRDALRSAQMEFLRTQPHPFFWAAFQLTGSP